MIDLLCQAFVALVIVQAPDAARLCLAQALRAAAVGDVAGPAALPGSGRLEEQGQDEEDARLHPRVLRSQCAASDCGGAPASPHYQLLSVAGIGNLLSRPRPPIAADRILEYSWTSWG